MKNILVAIDFSKTSLNALDYAVSLAKKAGANILMTWVDNTSGEEALYEGFPNEIRNEKIELFRDLKKNYKETFPGKIDYKTKKGKVYTEIANLAETSGTDLIIAGTHGVSGFEEFWIGSNAYRIVTHAPCPVITLRNSFLSREIKKIVLPVDSTQETRQKIPFTAKIASLFGAEVKILLLYTTGLKTVQKRVDNYASQAMKYFDDRKVKHSSDSASSDNITKSTIDYAVSEKADLIAIMTEQETTTANLFLGPYAQQMVNHSPIPILSVRAKELVEIPAN